MTADLYCLLGNPIEHSKSPWIHTRFAELTQQDLRYDKHLIPLDGFPQAVAALRREGGKGCNITVPFKFEAAPLATQLTARAELAGACNTLRFDGDEVFADNTDGVGLVIDITRNAGVNLKRADVLLIGAGGAAAGVLGPLIESGVRRIAVANRTQSKAAMLIERHAALAELHSVRLEAPELYQVHDEFDVVINGTASSLSGDGVPIDSHVLRRGTLACDMMYGPAAQGFMDWATRNGAVARDGLGMLVEQAAEAFQLWRGVRPPSVRVLSELRALIA